MTKEIILSDGTVCLVDDEDFEDLNKKRWQHSKRGYAVGNVNYGYKINKSVPMHRIIMGVTDPRVQVDHLDGNRLNNQKKNFRLVDNKENARNLHQHKIKNASSPYFGVTKDKRENLRKRWIAVIKVDYKGIFLGRYMTAEEAALAYNKAAERYGYLTRNEVN